MSQREGASQWECLKPRKRSGHLYSQTAEFPGKVRASLFARTCKPEERSAATAYTLTELRERRVEGRSAHTGAGTYKAFSSANQHWMVRKIGPKGIETLWIGALGEVCP